MFERIGNGLKLSKQSFDVLMLNKKLLMFPLFSAIACLLVSASFMVPVATTDVFLSSTNESGLSMIGYAMLFAFYVATYSVIIFFNTAIVECAIMHFRGQKPTVSDGFRGAMSRLPQILKWALLAATVGLILRSLEERMGFLGRIVIGFIGLAWSAATFFVVPVLVMERLGPIDATKRSIDIVKKTWAESFSANMGIGLIAMFFYVISMGVTGFGVLSLASGSSVGWFFVSTGVVSFILVALAASATQAIVTSALYMYAGQGVVPDQFQQETFDRVFGVITP